jgi:phage terminase large subunit-like protein
VESGAASRVALVAATAADCRDVMVEGPSGLLEVCPPWNRPLYEPSKRRLTWANGAVAVAFSADEPDRLRGPQHSAVWCDELAAWKFPEAWDMLLFGLRLGQARAVITTTPRPTDLIRKIQKNPATIETVGTTYENRANLAEEFFTTILSQYEGTRLGRQELNAEMLENVEGALWKLDDIEQNRVEFYCRDGDSYYDSRRLSLYGFELTAEDVNQLHDTNCSGSLLTLAIQNTIIRAEVFR